MTLLSRKVDYALLILSYLHHRPTVAVPAKSPNVFRSAGPSWRTSSNGCAAKVLWPAGAASRAATSCAVPRNRFAWPNSWSRWASRFIWLNVIERRPNAVCGLASVCPVRNAVGRLHRRLLDVLRTVTLAELFDPEGEAVCTQFGLTVCVREAQLTAT